MPRFCLLLPLAILLVLLLVNLRPGLCAKILRRRVWAMVMNLATNLSPEQALNQVNDLLERFTHFGVELGLERIERLLAALGNPERRVPIVHVAGSNGKGSVCAYLAAVLTTAGYRVGRYTSPHLVSWCERICLNQQPIPASELCGLLQEVVGAIDPEQTSPTQFEVITAAAWLYFARQQVDLAIVEVGLGGRLDATNVCDLPLVTVITSLSREHWQRLGPTLADISREKAGILKPARPAVIAPQPAEAAAVLQARLAQLNCPAIWVEPARDLGQGWAEFGMAATAPAATAPAATDPAATNPAESGFRYPLPLLGQHQRINSALALATLQLLQQQGWAISAEQIRAGMAQTEWPGRLQWSQWQQRPLLIDGAHNPAGAEMLRAYLDQNLNQSLGQNPGQNPGQSPDQRRVEPPIRWIIGMIGTKDHADILQALLRPGDTLYLVPVPQHLPTDLDQLAALALQICPELAACDICEDVILALNKAAQQDGTRVLCGSLYLIGHVMQLRPSELAGSAQTPDGSSV